MAHPFLDGSAMTLESLPESARGMRKDVWHYQNLMRGWVERWPDLFDEIMQPLLHLPKSPWLLAEFGTKALLSAEAF